MTRYVDRRECRSGYRGVDQETEGVSVGPQASSICRAIQCAPGCTVARVWTMLWIPRCTWRSLPSGFHGVVGGRKLTSSKVSDPIGRTFHKDFDSCLKQVRFASVQVDIRETVAIYTTSTGEILSRHVVIVIAQSLGRGSATRIHGTPARFMLSYGSGRIAQE